MQERWSAFRCQVRKSSTLTCAVCKLGAGGQQSFGSARQLFYVCALCLCVCVGALLGICTVRWGNCCRQKNAKQNAALLSRSHVHWLAESPVWEDPGSGRIPYRDPPLYLCQESPPRTSRRSRESGKEKVLEVQDDERKGPQGSSRARVLPEKHSTVFRSEKKVHVFEGAR